jgi:hypothetical protein
VSKGDDWTKGMRVVFVRDSRCGHVKVGSTGKLTYPRDCHCGPKGERCWDILLDTDDGRPHGIQAFGGDFDLAE